MKENVLHAVFSIFVLMHVLILCLLPISAQDYKRQNLPKGAKIRLGKGYINDSGKHVVQFSPDGTRLAVATSIGIWIYETQTYQEVAWLTGPNGWINNVSFSPDGRTLATGNWWGQVDLWDISTGKHRQTLIDHGVAYVSLSFNPDEQILASGGRGVIHLWDVSTGELNKTLDGHHHEVSVSFSPDGRTLATGSQSEIYLWDVSTDTRREIPINGGISGIRSMSFSPDGRILASGRENEIQLWDVSTATLRRTLKNESTTYGPANVSFSPDGQTLVSGNVNEIRLWDVSTGTLRKTLTDQRVVITSVSFSPDGQTLVSGGSEGVHLWDVSTGTLRKTLTGHNRAISSVSFSPNGQILASGSGRHIHLWDVSTGILRKTLTGYTEVYTEVYNVSFSPDGSTLASGGSEGIHLWDVSTGALRKTFIGHDLGVSSVSFSPDGSTLAGGSGDEIRLWDVSTGTLRKTFIKPYQQVLSVSFSPNGQTVISGGKGINLWDVSTGAHRTLLRDESYRILDIAFSPDGRMLAGCGYNTFIDLPSTNGGNGNDEDDESCKSIDLWVDGIIGLWDVSTGTLRIPHTTGYFRHVNGVSFSPNGRMLASGGESGIHLWDASTSIRRKTLAAPANSVAFSPDGRMLASGGPDGTVLLWDLTLITGVFPQLTPLTWEALTIPTETILLQNYPNPFNPETWIPYQLAESTHVSLCIYSANGTLIRTLFSCADHEAGTYKSPDRAAYWDGKNDIGEPVANGIYFYTLTAGELTSTRKMIIRK